MVTVSGIKFPTTGKVLQAPKTKVVLAYTKAMRDGKGQAAKFFKEAGALSKKAKKR